MAESRYCTADDLRALVPDLHRDAALADSFGGANADPGLLDIVLSSACDEVDALISGRVRLPLPADAIPSKLRTAAALFAAETLCIRRGASLPEALAEKVKWWRDWLSKIGEGDLRLTAAAESDDEAGKASAYMPAAITARPAITGSHGLLGAIALLLALGAALLPGTARAAVGHRTFSLAAPPDPATFSSVPSIEWERGESLDLNLSGATLAPGQFPRWQVADVSNLWMDVASSTLSFHADPATAAIPPGRYLGRVVVTNADSSLVRVLAVQNVRVLPGAPDLCPPEPASTLATTAWVEGWVAGYVATNHQSLEGMATEGWVAEYVAEHAPEPDLSGYVAKTNGEWVIVQGTAWNGIEWQGERVFGVEMDVTTNGMAIVTGIEVLATNRLRLSYRGAATNRLEACCDTATWETWDDCAWTPTGDTTGEVTVEGASPDCWYRVAPAAPVVDSWSNVAVVAYAPMYAGQKEAEKRYVTREELEDVAASRAHDATRGLLPSFGHSPQMVPGDETQTLWSFGPGGVYIRGLEIDKFRIGESFVTNFSQIADKVECKGGYKWPDYFRVANVYAGIAAAGSTNETVFATNTSYNVVEVLVTNYSMKGWRIQSSVMRKANESDAILWEPVDAGEGGIPPEQLVAEGEMISFADGVTGEQVTGTVARARGTLGAFTVEQDLAYDAAAQSTNSIVGRFVGPAPGSFLEHCWTNILQTASNAYAQGKSIHLRLWPEGYGSATKHVRATWNTNFWAWNLGDFSCISYHTDTPPKFDGGVYRPITMVTPRHGICADHYVPIIGSNCYWVTQSGGIATNRIIARKRIRGDLAVVRMEYAFDTNDIVPATLLQRDFVHYVYGSTVRTLGMMGIPCLSFDCAERGWVSGWKPDSLMDGRNGTDYGQSKYTDYFSAQGKYAFENGAYDGPYKGNGWAVGGDSGSPTFLIADGKAILLGCFATMGGGNMPHKDEVDEVIEEWGDEERCTEYSLGSGGWSNPDIPAPPQ